MNSSLKSDLLEQDNFDIRRYISLFLSNWYWFAISLLLALTIAYSINRYSEKLFTVSAILMINDNQYGSNRIISSVIPGGDVFTSSQNMTNEISILKSFSLNKRVIEALPEFRIFYYGVGRRNIVEKRLYKNAPFIILTDSIDNQPRYAKIKVKIISPESCLIEIDGYENSEKQVNFGESYYAYGFNFMIDIRDQSSFNYDLDASNKFYFYFTGSDELANIYRENLSATPIEKDATIVYLSKTGLVPQQEADYLNMLMEVYRNRSLEAKNQTAENTISFIDKQLSIVSDSLKRAELRLQELRQEDKLFDVAKDGSFLQARLEKLDNEIISLDLQKFYFNYLKEYLESRNESGNIISPNLFGINEPTLIRLVQELSSEQKEKNELLINLSADLTPVTYASKNIQNLQSALSENVKSSLKSIETIIADTRKRIALVDADIANLPKSESRRINIQREYDINNTVYTYLLEKRAETGIAKSSNVPDSKIIDSANILNAAQIKPTKSKNNLKALALGLIIPGVIIFFLYILNNKIIDNQDITTKTDVPVIGYISHNDKNVEIPVVSFPRSELSESFRAIRTSLKYFSKESSKPVIAITSTIGSEGKTFISVNLAAIIASLGKKVLLVGLDLRRPRVHKPIEIDNSTGLSTYLIGNCEYEDIIKETSVENLWFAPSGPVPPNPAELIEDERLDVFFRKAKEFYDYIIIDTPPVAVVSDALLITRFTDINLFIVRQRYSSKNTIELVQELSRENKLKHMAIIINDISLKGYYGYGINYGYYRGYGYSYGKNYYGNYSKTRYGYSDKEHGYYQA